MSRLHPNEVRQAVRGGIVAGLASGAILTLAMVTMSFARHRDVWYPMKGAAAPFLDGRALLPGFDAGAVLLGLLVHLAVSVAWAVPFALLVFGMKRFTTVVVGAAWGVAVWFGMYYVVLPIVGLSQMVDDAPVTRAIAYHVFFGVALATTFLPFQRPAPRGQAPRGAFSAMVHRWAHHRRPT